jgi:Flp pilus assembly protein protease CpaA
MAGGVIAGLSLVLKKWKPLKNPPAESWLAKAQEGHPSVPYGIAIAFGALASFLYTGYFSPDKWQSMFVGL